jgi:hypothetical protein
LSLLLRANCLALHTRSIKDAISFSALSPLNLSFGKTVIWKGRPWKLGAEINYFIDQPDALGPQWMFGINIAPVVENLFARIFQ